MLHRINNKVVIARKLGETPYTPWELIRMALGLAVFFAVIGGIYIVI